MGTPSKANMPFRRGKDKAFFGVICLFSGLTLIPLFLIIWELLVKGYKQLNLNFFTEVAPTSMDAMLAKVSGLNIPGGVLNGLTGSLLMLLIAIILAIPIGIFSGIYLAEHKDSKFSNAVRNIADMLQGMPSIVTGIIVYAWVVKPMFGYSALAGGITLAIMMLPLIIRSTEESVAMVPYTLKEAGLALGGSYTSVVLRIMLPAAFGGLFTGTLLAVSRILGETAPLLVTALGASMVNWNITDPTSALPLLIWEFYNDPNLADLVWSTSLFLLLLVLGLNLIAKSISKRWKIQ